MEGDDEGGLLKPSPLAASGKNSSSNVKDAVTVEGCCCALEREESASPSDRMVETDSTFTLTMDVVVVVVSRSVE